MILGIIKKDQESIEILGKSIEDAKGDIALVLDNMFFPVKLNPKDLGSILKSIYKNWDDDHYKKYLEDFKIEEKTMIKKMSKGMKKKLEIATALSHHPKLLILDDLLADLILW